MEIWKPISGYEGYYEISNYGNFRSVDRWVNTKGNTKKFIKGKDKPVQTRKGTKYKIITLCKKNVLKTYQVHQLVMLHFKDGFIKGTEVNHIDGNPENNRINNLEESNRSHNQLHACAMGLKKKQGKSKYTGVFYNSRNTNKPWIATLHHNGKSSYGWKGFATEEEAALHANYLMDRIGCTMRKRNIVP